MSTIEPNELPKRPNSIKLYGKHDETILVMENKYGQIFDLEHIGDDVFELTVHVYSHKDRKHPDLARTEYVIHTNKNMLKGLVALIHERIG